MLINLFKNIIFIYIIFSYKINYWENNIKNLYNIYKFFLNNIYSTEKIRFKERIISTITLISVFKNI